MSCKACIDASATPGAELTFTGRFSRWFHTTVCPPCRAYFKGIAATQRVLGALRTEADPDLEPVEGDPREAELVSALRARTHDK